MRKFLFLLGLLVTLVTHFSVSNATDVSWSDPTPPTASDCNSINSNSGSNNGRNWVLSSGGGTSVAPTGANAVCEVHNYYTATNTYQKAVSGVMTSCNGLDRVIAFDGSQITCAKYDDTPPTDSDVTNNNATNLLANNSYPYALSIADGGNAPIVRIEGYKENKSDQSLSFFSETVVPWSTSWDISNVDGFRLLNGGRDMTIRITRICDEAGNCWNGSNDATNPLNKTHHVFSNTTPSFLTSTSVAVQSHNLANGTSTADGQLKPLTIKLSDKYGNAIIPALGINRQVDLNFTTDNDLYIDQYNLSGPSVFVNSPDGVVNQIFSMGESQLKSFNNQPSSTGAYTFGFRVYTPTKIAYDKAWGGFSTDYITFDATDTIRTTSTETVNNSAIAFKFNPLYYVELGGDLKSGMTEGIKQDSALELKRNASSVDGSARLVKVEYGGTEANKFKMYGGTSTVNAKVGGNQITTIEDVVSAITFPTSSVGFYTFLAQNAGAVGNSSNTYLSTHITYTMPNPAGWFPLNILYNSDIIGKANYHDAIYTDYTQQAGVKVLWLAYSKKTNSITTDQIPVDVNIFGSIDKFINKTQITKNAQQTVKGVVLGAEQNDKIITQNRLNVVSWSNGKLLSTASGSTILYFGWLNGGNVTLWDGSANIGVNGKRTVLVIGGNVYIKSNLYYANNKSLLGIIALKDAQGRGGNIYIDPGVTNVVGSLFASKSLLSYGYDSSDGTYKEFGSSTSLKVLKNQLHIYGSVFTENTVGGSRKSIPECPYYISKASCTSAVAQKYDLNYLRRYYRVNNIYPYGEQGNAFPAKVIGGWACDTSGVCNGSKPGAATVPNAPRTISNTNASSASVSPYAKYPVIIEYNPLYRSVQPPLFSLSRG